MRRHAIVCIFALTACSVIGGPAFAARRGALPDLAPAAEPLRENYLSREGNRLLLRFPTVIENRGRGPAEVVGKRASPRARMLAYQHFYDRKAKRVRRRRIGSYHYHGEHSHWHLLSIAQYRLLRPDGSPATEGIKVSFCLRDNEALTPRVPGAPLFGQYGDCTRDRRALRVRAGISVGWSDIYAAYLPDQWVDVTGLPAGEYFLECTVDPESRLEELTRENNTARVRVTLP